MEHKIGLNTAEWIHFFWKARWAKLLSAAIFESFINCIRLQPDFNLNFTETAIIWMVISICHLTVLFSSLSLDPFSIYQLCVWSFYNQSEKFQVFKNKHISPCSRHVVLACSIHPSIVYGMALHASYDVNRFDIAITCHDWNFIRCFLHQIPYKISKIAKIPSKIPEWMKLHTKSASNAEWNRQQKIYSEASWKWEQMK